MLYMNCMDREHVKNMIIGIWIFFSDNVTKKVMIAVALGIIVLIFFIIAVVVKYRRRYEL